MAKTSPILVNGELFTTKKALAERVRAIRDRYPDYALLSEQDFLFMLDLLGRHKEADQKIGAGVVSMHVEIDALWRTTRHFCLTRVDGTHTDFSFMECLTPTPPRRLFAEACRSAVRADIIRYKLDHFTGACELTGQPITHNQAHVDHVCPLTFDRLVNDFAGEYGVNMDDPSLVIETLDGDITVNFRDPDLSEKFRTYHNNRAELRIIDGAINLRLGRSTAAGST